MKRSFIEQGLHNVEETQLLIRMEYESFADYWEPITSGEGPLGKYAAGLDLAMRAKADAAVRDAYEAGRPDGPRSFVSIAWACRGTVIGPPKLTFAEADKGPPARISIGNGNDAYRVGRGIQAGRVWTNCYHAYPAHAAFGGNKASGFGRGNHKMMLDHYQQTKNLLVSYSTKGLGFSDPWLGEMALGWAIVSPQDRRRSARVHGIGFSGVEITSHQLMPLTARGNRLSCAPRVHRAA